MINLLPNHRIRIPNKLAIFAAMLLLVSSVVGYESSQNVHFSGQLAPSSLKADSVESDGMSDGVEQKRRGLNLGLLLFRRG